MKQYTNKDLDSLEQNDQQSKIDKERKGQQEEWKKLPQSIQEAFDHFDSTYDLYSAVVIMAIDFSTNAFANDSIVQENSKFELRVMIDSLLKILSSKNDLLALQKPVQDMARKQLIQRLVKLCVHLQQFAVAKLRRLKKKNIKNLRAGIAFNTTSIRSNIKDLEELIPRTWILSLQLYAYWKTHNIAINQFWSEKSNLKVKQEITPDAFMEILMNFINTIRVYIQREKEFEGKNSKTLYFLIPKQDDKVQLLRDNILPTIEHKIIEEIRKGYNPEDIKELQSMIHFIIKYIEIAFQELELSIDDQNISEHPKIVKILPFLVRIQIELDKQTIQSSQNKILPKQNTQVFANLKFDKIYRIFDVATNDKLYEILDEKLATTYKYLVQLRRYNQFETYMEQTRETFKELRQCIKEKEISNRYTIIKETQMQIHKNKDYQELKDRILKQVDESKNAFQEFYRAKTNNQGDEEGKQLQKAKLKKYNEEIEKLKEIETLPVLNEFWDAYQEYQFIKAMQKHQVYNTVSEILELTKKFESKFDLMRSLKPKKCDPSHPFHKRTKNAPDCPNKCDGRHKEYVEKFLSVERIYLQMDTIKAVDTLVEAKIEDQAWIDQYNKDDKQQFFGIIQSLSKELHSAEFFIQANEYSWEILLNEIRELRRQKRGPSSNFEKKFKHLFDQMEQIYQDALNKRDPNQDEKAYNYFKIEAIENKEDGSTILPIQKGRKAQFIIQEISQFVSQKDETQKKKQNYKQDMTSLQSKINSIFGHGSLNSFNVIPDLDVLTRDVLQLYCSDEEYENLRADTRKHGNPDNIASKGVQKFYQINSFTNPELRTNFRERVEKEIKDEKMTQTIGDKQFVPKQKWIKSSLSEIIEEHSSEDSKLTKDRQYEKVKQIFQSNQGSPLQFACGISLQKLDLHIKIGGVFTSSNLLPTTGWRSDKVQVSIEV